jgi:hypothetical protein
MKINCDCRPTKRGNELPPIDTIPVGVHSVGRHGLLCWLGAADRPVAAIFHVVPCPTASQSTLHYSPGGG